jgi:hypothetical protein
MRPNPGARYAAASAKRRQGRSGTSVLLVRRQRSTAATPQACAARRETSSPTACCARRVCVESVRYPETQVAMLQCDHWCARNSHSAYLVADLKLL